jgi:uncharacterized membrane protein YqiK
MPPPLAAALGGGLLLLACLVLIVVRYRRVELGQALLLHSRLGRPRVTFNGAVVLPLLHRAEVMDLSLRVVRVSLRGRESILCQDGLRADLKVAFYVRVDKSPEAVLAVSRGLGGERARDEATLERLFADRFAAAVREVGGRFALEDIYPRREAFKAGLRQVIGEELGGFVLDGCAIDHLEKTPPEDLEEG